MELQVKRGPRSVTVDVKAERLHGQGGSFIPARSDVSWLLVITLVELEIYGEVSPILLRPLRVNVATDRKKIYILGKQVKVAGVWDLWEALLCVTKALLGHVQGGKVAQVSGPTCPQGEAVHICANPHVTSKELEHLDTRHM